MRLPFMALFVCSLLVFAFCIGSFVEAWFDSRAYEAAYQECLKIPDQKAKTGCIMDLIKGKARGNSR